MDILNIIKIRPNHILLYINKVLIYILLICAYISFSDGQEIEEVLAKAEPVISTDDLKTSLTSEVKIPFWISPEYVKLIQPEIDLDDPALNINGLLYDDEFTNKLLEHSEIPDDLKEFVKEQNNVHMQAVVPPTPRRPYMGNCEAFTWQDLKNYYNPGIGFSRKRNPNPWTQDVDFINTALKDINPKKIKCAPKKLDNDSIAEVRIMNSTDLMELISKRNDSNNNSCAVVLFYAPWCPFCAKTAPHFNALARAFKHLDVIAIDAVNFNKFGTVAVPNILIFHNSKAVARFNQSERVLETMVSFVENVTGIVGDHNVTVTDDDYLYPLKSEVSDQPDYFLYLSWVFIVSFCVTHMLRTELGQFVINSVWKIGETDHPHID